jgi:hypothetical protein
VTDRTEYMRKYLADNRERILARNRAYWHANKHWLEAKPNRVRRVRKRKPLTPEKRQEINLVRKVARSLGVTQTEARRQLGITSKVTTSRPLTRTAAASTPAGASCAET